MYLIINYFLFQESTPCNILVEIDDKRHQATIGRIIPTGLAEYMHGSPDLLDEVRVTPDEVKDGFHHITGYTGLALFCTLLFSLKFV
jgi:hypothetical protein